MAYRPSQPMTIIAQLQSQLQHLGSELDSSPVPQGFEKRTKAIQQEVTAHIKALEKLQTEMTEDQKKLGEYERALGLLSPKGAWIYKNGQLIRASQQINVEIAYASNESEASINQRLEAAKQRKIEELGTQGNADKVFLEKFLKDRKKLQAKMLVRDLMGSDSTQTLIDGINQRKSEHATTLQNNQSKYHKLYPEKPDIQDAISTLQTINQRLETFIARSQDLAKPTQSAALAEPKIKTKANETKEKDKKKKQGTFVTFQYKETPMEVNQDNAQSVIDGISNAAYQEGESIGYQNGIREGYENGIQEGIEQGKTLMRLENVSAVSDNYWATPRKIGTFGTHPERIQQTAFLNVIASMTQNNIDGNFIMWAALNAVKERIGATKGNKTELGKAVDLQWNIFQSACGGDWVNADQKYRAFLNENYNAIKDSMKTRVNAIVYKHHLVIDQVLLEGGNQRFLDNITSRPEDHPDARGRLTR